MEWLSCILAFAIAGLALGHGCDEHAHAYEERQQKGMHDPHGDGHPATDGGGTSTCPCPCPSSSD